MQISCVFYKKWYNKTYIAENQLQGEESMDKDYITLTIGKQKNIALIAHDGKKAALIQWCQDNIEGTFPVWNRHDGKNEY